MSWVARNLDGDLPVASKPKPVEVTEEKAKRDPILKRMHEAIEAADASNLPGAPKQLADTISLQRYAPPQSAIDAALE